MRGLPLALCAILLFSGCLAPASETTSQDPADAATSRSPRSPGVVPPVQPPASGGDGPDGGDGGEGTGADGSQGPGGSGENHAPAIAAYTASIAVGSPPIDVTFEFALDDADDDSLAWRLDFGDASDSGNDAFGFGTAATITHLYSRDGTYNATLQVTDGRSATVEKTLKLTMTKGVGTVSVNQDVATDCSIPCDNCETALTSYCFCDPELGFTNLCQCEGSADLDEIVNDTAGQHFTPVEEACDAADDYTPVGPHNVTTGPGGLGCPGFGQEGAQGAACVWFPIPQTAQRRPFVVTSDAGNPTVEFWDDCATTGSRIGGQRNPGAEIGNAIPLGTKCLLAYESSLAPGGTTIYLTYG